jgi:hypothetical protein
MARAAAGAAGGPVAVAYADAPATRQGS